MWSNGLGMVCFSLRQNTRKFLTPVMSLRSRQEIAIEPLSRRRSRHVVAAERRNCRRTVTRFTVRAVSRRCCLRDRMDIFQLHSCAVNVICLKRKCIAMQAPIHSSLYFIIYAQSYIRKMGRAGDDSVLCQRGRRGEASMQLSRVKIFRDEKSRGRFFFQQNSLNTRFTKLSEEMILMKETKNI